MKSISARAAAAQSAFFHDGFMLTKGIHGKKSLVESRAHLSK
jgi:hypothetical protein